MARKRAKPDKGLEQAVKVPSTPSFRATTKYKQWVRREMKARGLTLRSFAADLKKIDPEANATSGGISLFLGREDRVPIPSNSTLVPLINKLFGEPPPPVHEPDADESAADLRVRLVALLEQLDGGEQEFVLNTAEKLVALKRSKP